MTKKEVGLYETVYYQAKRKLLFLVFPEPYCKCLYCVCNGSPLGKQDAGLDVSQTSEHGSELDDSHQHSMYGNVVFYAYAFIYHPQIIKKMKQAELTAALIMQTVKDMVGTDNPLYFDEPVEVKANPHSVPCMIHGICVSPEEKIYLVTYDDMHCPAVEIWSKLESPDRNYELVLSSLYQRVYLLAAKKKTA